MDPFADLLGTIMSWLQQAGAEFDCGKTQAQRRDVRIDLHSESYILLFLLLWIFFNFLVLALNFVNTKLDVSFLGSKFDSNLCLIRNAQTHLLDIEKRWPFP